jgi:YHS domain-containing protein
MVNRQNKPSAMIDPVCGNTIDPARSNPTTVFKGETYYFCQARCQQRFEKTPAKFAGGDKKHPPPPKWWSRYLDRVQKATGGKPPSCCQ